MFYKPKPKRRLMTLDDFNQQSEDFTVQALEDLKKYCKSSDCDIWNLCTRLKNPDRYVTYSKFSCEFKSTKIIFIIEVRTFHQIK